jgi:hypothetical protein
MCKPREYPTNTSDTALEELLKRSEDSNKLERLLTLIGRLRQTGTRISAQAEIRTEVASLLTPDDPLHPIASAELVEICCSDRIISFGKIPQPERTELKTMTTIIKNRRRVLLSQQREEGRATSPSHEG